VNVEGQVKGQICWDGGEVAAGASQLEGRVGKKYYLGVGTRASQWEEAVLKTRSNGARMKGGGSIGGKKNFTCLFHSSEQLVSSF
jgi:hypothetical protein